MIVMKRRCLMVILMLLLLLAACGDSTATNSSASGKIKVVATNSVIADMAKNVAGDRAEIYAILKPGRDAHDYEPTAEDSKALAVAQLVLSNGLGLEAWLDKTVQSSGTKASLAAVSEGVNLLKTVQGETDPHIWHGPDNGKIMADNIAKGLAKVDAAGKATYEANAASYKTQIDDTSRQMKGLLDAIPAERRKLVTNHEAFTYFAAQFNLKIVGSIIPSFDSASEPSAQALTELVKRIKAEKVPAIFTETTINPKLAEQISKEAGVKIFSNLYGDALGDASSDGSTYLKMLLSNARNIANGLK